MIVRFKNRPACEGTDTEMWFPANGNFTDEQYLKRVCASCPARTECLTYALEYGVSGIWGGTNASERKKIRRERGIIAKPILAEWELRRA